MIILSKNAKCFAIVNHEISLQNRFYLNVLRLELIPDEVIAPVVIFVNLNDGLTWVGGQRLLEHVFAQVDGDFAFLDIRFVVVAIANAVFVDLK